MSSGAVKGKYKAVTCTEYPRNNIGIRDSWQKKPPFSGQNLHIYRKTRLYACHTPFSLSLSLLFPLQKLISHVRSSAQAPQRSFQLCGAPESPRITQCRCAARLGRSRVSNIGGVEERWYGFVAQASSLKSRVKNRNLVACTVAKAASPEKEMVLYSCSHKGCELALAEY
jgi:hypothetical protein